MKKWIIILSTLVFLGIIGGFLGYRYIYNKPHVDFEKAKVDHAVAGEQLFNHFTSDRAEAEKQFNGKVLAVEGRVTSVETNDSMTIVVFALDKGMFGDEGIRFTMLENHRELANALARDQLVTIKGYCTGYNDTDIILEKCSIIKQ